MVDKDKLGHDKVLHALACFGISLYSTEAAIAAALAKEYGDKNARGNHWCWWDLEQADAGRVKGGGQLGLYE